MKTRFLEIASALTFLAASCGGKGHALVWHGDSPAWLEGLSSGEARIALEDHIRTTLGRYRGRLLAWDVVNEAIADDRSGLRDTVYLRKLLVNMSEMDVRVARLPGDLGARLEEQRRVYHDVVATCVAEPRCHAVTFWGFTDAHSWIDGTFGPDDPLLFDDSYRAKPAYFGVLDALRGR